MVKNAAVLKVYPRALAARWQRLGEWLLGRFAGSTASGLRAVLMLRTANRRVVTRRVMVHGRWVKVTCVVRSAPCLSCLQQHPDTDRYQEIQKALSDRGYFKGEPNNGQWDDDSMDAMKRFQIDQKLDADGKINARSLIGLGLGRKHDGSVGAPSLRLQLPLRLTFPTRYRLRSTSINLQRTAALKLGPYSCRGRILRRGYLLIE